MTMGAWFGASELVVVCLGCFVLQTRAQVGNVQSSLLAPNLTGAAAVADGTVQRPYQVILKECYPFSIPKAAEAGGGFTGYAVDQVDGINTEEYPFNVQYYLLDTSYDGALEMLG